tara:strand:- start:157 stop:477 length:321 start_codon:yes stop_codon:yes gene_type:complete
MLEVSRIEEVCGILEKLGPTGVMQVAKLMRPTVTNKKVGSQNASKYCARAADIGLITVNDDEDNHIYTVNPNWRKIMAGEETAIKPINRRISMFSFAPSIFHLMHN